MYHVLLYVVSIVSFIGLFLAVIACVRVGQLLSKTEGLDWNAVANITGDLATLKKTIQTLNNRINGMHSPKIAEQELMMQLLNNQQKQQPNGKIRGG
jgi:hypothetical protein